MSVVSDTGPFAILPRWVLRSGISDRAVRLYGLLADHADRESGESWPRRARLGEMMGCSSKSVDRAVHELVVLGAVTITPRHDEDGGQRSNLYTIHRLDPGSEPAEAASPLTQPLDTDGEGPLDGADAQKKNHPEPAAARRSSASTIPDPFDLTVDMRGWARQHAPSIDLRIHTQRFVNHAKERQRRQRDWTLAWKNWMLKEEADVPTARRVRR